MSKGVRKQCSILNYLRHHDEDMYELVQDLCLGKMFMPKRGMPGITFLRPDRPLFLEIQKKASSDEPEKAIEMLQSLILLDNISDISEFESRKKNIPTYLHKKLPVKEVKGNKVILANDAEITKDSEFESRDDRNNISVYILSKALVDLSNGEDADLSQLTTRKPKKGGADLNKLNDRKVLFENVLRVFCKSPTDPAMELIVTLYDHFKNNNGPMADFIKSQTSYDSLASLAIILQPYKSTHTISDDVLKTALSSIMTSSMPQFKTDTNIFSFNPKVKDAYDALCNDQTYSTNAKRIQTFMKTQSDKMAKLNAISILKNILDSNTTKTSIQLRDNTSLKERMAEAELRIMSAIVQENSDCNNDDYDELLQLFKNCTLDSPYMCNADLMSSSNVGFYYSTAYLMVRSDALVYMPGYDGSTTDCITDDNAFISLNKTFEHINNNRRNASQQMLSSLADKFRR